MIVTIFAFIVYMEICNISELPKDVNQIVPDGTIASHLGYDKKETLGKLLENDANVNCRICRWI